MGGGDRAVLVACRDFEYILLGVSAGVREIDEDATLKSFLTIWPAYTVACVRSHQLSSAA